MAVVILLLPSLCGVFHFDPIVSNCIERVGFRVHIAELLCVFYRGHIVSNSTHVAAHLGPSARSQRPLAARKPLSRMVNSFRHHL